MESAKTRKNHQILQKFWGNEENHTTIFLAAFGTKSVHSAVVYFEAKWCTKNIWKFQDSNLYTFERRIELFLSN